MSELHGDARTCPESLADLETLLGYRFKDKALLLQALTHRSYANEHGGEGLKNNEALEFLGDAVLGFLISSRIFRHFPDFSEGDLSKIKAYLVSAANLIRLAENIRLGHYLNLGRGEEKTGGRNKKAILADAWEAALGAIYVDGGVEAASAFMDSQLGDWLEVANIGELTSGDPKSALQEQLHDLGRTEPFYQVVDEIGPDHQKVFVVQVLINEQVVAQASGKTKKGAEKEAARIALEGLKNE